MLPGQTKNNLENVDELAWLVKIFTILFDMINSKTIDPIAKSYSHFKKHHLLIIIGYFL